jgi:hypothetical protein
LRSKIIMPASMAALNMSASVPPPASEASGVKLVLAIIVCFLFLGTEQPVQQLQYGQGLGAGDAVEDLLAFTARVDQIFIASHRQLLGQGRLADAEHGVQLADAVRALA